MPRLTERDFLAALAGAGQNLTMDFGDEIYGGGMGLYDAVTKRAPISEAYKRYRDEARGELKELEKESPNAYMAGEIGSFFVPGFGQAGVAANASKPLLKKAMQMALMGGASGLGRSEADNAGDMAKDTLSSAAMSAGAGVSMDQFMRRIGDVIDFKKMRDKIKEEKILDDAPGKVTGNLGKPSKEAMAENNRRALEEAGLLKDSFKMDPRARADYSNDEMVKTVKSLRESRPKELEADAESFAKARVEAGDWDSFEDAKNWYLKYWGPEAIEKRARTREKKKANDELEKAFMEDFKSRIGVPDRENQWPYRALPEGTRKGGLRLAGEPMDWESYARAVEDGKTRRSFSEVFEDRDGIEAEKYRVFRDLAQTADRAEALEAIAEDLKKGKYKDIKNRAQVKKRFDAWKKNVEKNLMKGTTFNQSRRDWEWNPEE